MTRRLTRAEWRAKRANDKAELASLDAQLTAGLAAQGYRLIHWRGTPSGTCTRKDTGADQIETKSGPSTVVQTALADHAGNVTCPVCKAAVRYTGPVATPYSETPGGPEPGPAEPEGEPKPEGEEGEGKEPQPA